jgi:hypothetical protein
MCVYLCVWVASVRVCVCFVAADYDTRPGQVGVQCVCVVPNKKQKQKIFFDDTLRVKCACTRLQSDVLVYWQKFSIE